MKIDLIHLVKHLQKDHSHHHHHHQQKQILEIVYTMN